MTVILGKTMYEESSSECGEKAMDLRSFRGRNNCLDVGMSSSTVKPIAEFLPEASSSLLEGGGDTEREADLESRGGCQVMCSK